MLESSFILGPFHSVNVRVDHECSHTMNPYRMIPAVLSWSGTNYPPAFPDVFVSLLFSAMFGGKFELSSYKT